MVKRGPINALCDCKRNAIVISRTNGHRERDVPIWPDNVLVALWWISILWLSLRGAKRGQAGNCDILIFGQLT